MVEVDVTADKPIDKSWRSIVVELGPSMPAIDATDAPSTAETPPNHLIKS